MQSIHLNERLDGERLYLKKHELSLAKQMFEFVNRDRERLLKFMPWVPFIKSVDDQKAWIESTFKMWEEKSEFNYGIYLKNDQYVGNLGVHSLRWAHDCGEIGYWILGYFEGNGYVTEAVELIQKHMFEVGFHRVQIRCSDLNERSEGVPKRLGYVFEGISRDDTFILGKFRNTKTFSMLSTD